MKRGEEKADDLHSRCCTLLSPNNQQSSPARYITVAHVCVFVCSARDADDGGLENYRFDDGR